MNEYKYADIKVGQEEKFEKKITKEMEDAFRKMTDDRNPMHYDDEYAKEVSEGKYDKHITFGMLTASMLSTMAGMYMPGKHSLIHSIEDIKFKTPVYVGDILTITGVVKEKLDGLNLILLKVIIKNQNEKIVCSANMKIIVQK